LKFERHTTNGVVHNRKYGKKKPTIFILAQGESDSSQN